MPSQPGWDHSEHRQRPRVDLEEVHNRITAISDMLQYLRHDIRSLRTSLCGEGELLLAAPGSDPVPDTEPVQPVFEADAAKVLTAKNALDDGAVYVGGNPVPAIVAALTEDNNTNFAVHSILEKIILPIFYLDNKSATYPFVDLWGIPHGSIERIELLCKITTGCQRKMYADVWPVP